MAAIRNWGCCVDERGKAKKQLKQIQLLTIRNKKRKNCSFFSDHHDFQNQKKKEKEKEMIFVQLYAITYLSNNYHHHHHHHH